MPTSTDAEKTKSFMDIMLQAVENLATLRIMTLVGDVKVTTEMTDGKSDKLDFKVDIKGAPAIVSTIDLVQGDVSTAIDDTLMTPEHVELRAMHEQKVKDANQIIKENLARIGEMVTTFRDVMAKKV